MTTPRDVSFPDVPSFHVCSSPKFDSRHFSTFGRSVDQVCAFQVSLDFVASKKLDNASAAKARWDISTRTLNSKEVFQSGMPKTKELSVKPHQEQPFGERLQNWFPGSSVLWRETYRFPIKSRVRENCIPDGSKVNISSGSDSRAIELARIYSNVPDLSSRIQVLIRDGFEFGI